MSFVTNILDNARVEVTPSLGRPDTLPLPGSVDAVPQGAYDDA